MEWRDKDTAKLSRRTILGWLGSALGAVIVAGCGGGGSSATTSTTGTTTTGTTSSTSSGGTTSSTGTCTVTPEGEIGPYFTDDSATAYDRSNILSNLDGSDTQTGIPLTLHIYVYDAENTCAAMQGVQVDIWHCNAPGVYSNEAVENTTGQSWLRGYQLTDATGLVTFTTIVPGWYSGRTTHIHLRLRSKYSEASSTSDGTNTTQLFFPQATINTINSSVAPYSSHGTNPTTNAGDRVYASQTKGEMELTLSGNVTNGYTATAAIHLPITSA